MLKGGLSPAAVLHIAMPSADAKRIDQASGNGAGRQKNGRRCVAIFDGRCIAPECDKDCNLSQTGDGRPLMELGHASWAKSAMSNSRHAGHEH